ncbi:peptidoglycan DD-metalloendopeptidase family protein [Janibacter hoylei]|uniref:peptidoglycan DD-metalloendopeptidase family protein n=1 Tax=Janibacter hoylei TaxID=364298 RepID=UPI0021A4E1AA|nr:peptidoglycan DD-metalloendopeptidase family protein [Janibacter hoylei]MCT2292595.1 peptidoglycan DD-metalloendopeptidase family protein [Janibacter hoylei]
MRTTTTRTATALGLLALTAGGLFTASPAQAADRDGRCDSGEFCYNFNSDLGGSWSDFKGSVTDYGTSQPGCYEFKGAGAGKGKCIKNDAGGFWNKTGKKVTIYYNSGHVGKSVTVAPGAKGKLPAAVYNNNASHKIGSSSTPGKTNMSTALYTGGGGRLTTGFDGYNSTPGRHEGIDFAKGAGSSVRSLTSGTVTASPNDSIGTIAVYVPSADKTVIYLHAKSKVKAGDKITKGQVIASESSIGAGSAVHTHVEMRPGRQTRASKSVGDPTSTTRTPPPSGTTRATPSSDLRSSHRRLTKGGGPGRPAHPPSSS